MNFSQWYKIKESSLRDILKVPQDSGHHSEGDVDHHTYMVRNSINKAIEHLRKKQAEEPTGSLKNIDFNLTPEEIKTLKLTAWLHDIGKGEAFGRNEKGKITAIGHDTPEKYEKAMRKLGPAWQKMYQMADPKTVEDIKFLISNHMKVQSKKLAQTMLDPEGHYIDSSRVKMLIIFWVMDHVGRGGSPDSSRKQRLDYIGQNTDAVNSAVNRIYDLSAAVQAKKAAQAQHVVKKPTIDDPSGFAKMLKAKGTDYNTIKRAIQGKFGREFSDAELQGLIGESIMSFRNFLENLEDEGHAISANIPVDPEVEMIAKLFKQNGKHLYVVGGAVRDYLFHQHDTNVQKKAYKPKDIDLSTNASPEEILQILQNGNVRAVPKGEAFGVISAIVNKKEYEIASFRSEWYDPESGDGRRPDKVKTGVTAKEDASRRDLTMNALFYDITDKKIVDFNLTPEGRGQGIEDIKNKVARPVGDPRDRFREDKLRIPRLIRFFSRFNTGEIMSHLDKNTTLAIQEFKDLKGVSPERVRAEFLAGLDKCINPATYLNNYHAFDLLTNVVFPGLKLFVSGINNLQNTRDPVVVIAYLVQGNDPYTVREQLNKLTYPNNMADAIEYLLRLMRFEFSPQQDQNNMKSTIALIKGKDKVIPQQLQQFAQLTGMDLKRITHLLNYQLPKIDSQALMNQGFTKDALGQQIRLQQMQHYHGDYDNQQSPIQ